MIRNRLISRYLANASYQHAQASRNNDATEYDTLLELTHAEPITLGHGSFTYALIDEESKININSASVEILQNLPGFSQELVDNFQESEYRPLGMIEELLLVEGVTKEIFEQCKETITVYSAGHVNINTAHAQALQALGMDDSLIDIIERFRNGPDGVFATDDDGIFEEASNIIEYLRSFTGLFQKQEVTLLGLINKNLLGVASSAYTLHVSTTVLGKRSVSYAIVMNQEGIVKWTEQ